VVENGGLRASLPVEDTLRTYLGDVVAVAGELVEQCLRAVLEWREPTGEITK
jgi:hypothetical protein